MMKGPAGESGNGELTVAHSMGIWLSQTMTWLYTQIRSLPADVKSFVVADRTSNLDQFPLANLTSADLDNPVWKKLGELSWQVARRRQKALLRREIRKHRPRILHSHFGDRGWANMQIAARFGLRHVVSYYGYDASRLPKLEPEWRDRYAELFQSVDRILCEGPFLAQTIVDLGCPPEKVAVHHLGVPVGEIEFREREWRPGQSLKVLIAGSFLEKKGIPYAIQALGRVRQEATVELTIIGDSNGQPRSDREKEKILKALDTSGLRDQTRLLGYQPHDVLMREAHAHHIFLSPSVVAEDGDSEGGAPVALIEMAATGIPIVSSTHCDIPNVIVDGETGLLCRERDVDHIADRLRWLLGNPDQWRELSRKSRQRIEDQFDCMKLAANLRQHYLDVLQ